MWLISRAQLDDSVKQQVELAAVALERWLDDQKKAEAFAGAKVIVTGTNDAATKTIRIATIKPAS